MDTGKSLFLEAVRASLDDQKVQWDVDIALQDWLALFHMAEIHHMLPMIYEAVYTCPAAGRLPSSFLLPFKQKVIHQVLLQTRKTGEFLALLQYLQNVGIRPLVVKGIICRNLYPRPDDRLSGDEDILIPAEQFPKCHAAMLDYGMELLEPDKDIDNEFEVSYGKKNSTLYIELHKSLFAPDSEAYGQLNKYFENIHESSVTEEILGVMVAAPDYTDHLFFLICHVFKHFLHSGFGIRQVCDIVMFANAYGQEIRWKEILEHCRAIRGDKFAAALFRIGEKYFDFSPDRAAYPKEWQTISIDEMPLLEDMLEGGIYGSADRERQHSSKLL